MCHTLNNLYADNRKRLMAASGRQQGFSTIGDVSERLECKQDLSNPNAASAETTLPSGPENWKSIGCLAQVLMRRADR